MVQPCNELVNIDIGRLAHPSSLRAAAGPERGVQSQRILRLERVALAYFPAFKVNERSATSRFTRATNSSTATGAGFCPSPAPRVFTAT